MAPKTPAKKASVAKKSPTVKDEATPKVTTSADGRVRIHVLAADIGVTSKETLAAAANYDPAVKTASSSVTTEVANKVRAFFKDNPDPTPPKKATKAKPAAKKAAPKKAKAAPKTAKKAPVDDEGGSAVNDDEEPDVELDDEAGDEDDAVDEVADDDAEAADGSEIDDDEDEAKDAKADEDADEDAKGFVVSDTDEEDQPVQTVVTAGATADPVKDYLSRSVRSRC